LFCSDNGGKQIVENSSAPLAESDNSKRIGLAETQHNFLGIYLQTYKNLVDGGHKYSTAAYNQRD
jgi:hypothetical protein